MKALLLTLTISATSGVSVASALSIDLEQLDTIEDVFESGLRLSRTLSLEDTKCHAGEFTAELFLPEGAEITSMRWDGASFTILDDGGIFVADFYAYGLDQGTAAKILETFYVISGRPKAELNAWLRALGQSDLPQLYAMEEELSLQWSEPGGKTIGVRALGGTDEDRPLGIRIALVNPTPHPVFASTPIEAPVGYSFEESKRRELPSPSRIEASGITGDERLVETERTSYSPEDNTNEAGEEDGEGDGASFDGVKWVISVLLGVLVIIAGILALRQRKGASTDRARH